MTRLCPTGLLKSRVFGKLPPSSSGGAEVTQNPFCGNLSLSLSDTTEGHLRRAIYHLVHSIADAKVQTILLNRVDCG